ncbi:hypothetical protein [Roseibium sp.]|uniref:hypothetical protein n=1 Tax=Roseibium sp. TaxID=1936156 RepID=UPI003BADB639
MLRLIATYITFSVFASLVFVTSVQAEKRCAKTNQPVDRITTQLVNDLLSGDYDSFIREIGKSIPMNDSNSGFINPLREHFPNGFSQCRYVGKKKLSENLSTYFVELSTHEGSVFVYMLSLKENSGFAGGIMQIQISTDFVEIFEYWS